MLATPCVIDTSPTRSSPPHRSSPSSTRRTRQPAAEPASRTMHTLIPAMASRDGRPWASFGNMGGDGQPQLQSQVLINLVDFSLEPAEAVARPRIRVQADGVRTSIEADYPGAGELARSSRDFELMPSKHHSFGHAHEIVIDGPGGWRAGADPRSDGPAEFPP